MMTGGGGIGIGSKGGDAGGGAGADDDAPTAILFFLLFEGIRFSLGMYSPNRVAALEVSVLAMP